MKKRQDYSPCGIEGRQVSTHVGSQTTYAEPGHVIPPLGTGLTAHVDLSALPPQGALNAGPSVLPQAGAVFRCTRLDKYDVQPTLRFSADSFPRLATTS